ncbi:hypothetical protein B2J89_12300 [Acidovorax sp. SRB_24]|nr:hypothetical protein [Acidovorax sp. SRB_24]
MVGAQSSARIAAGQRRMSDVMRNPPTSHPIAPRMETDAPLPSHPWLPWVVALGLWLALAGVASVALWQLRRDAVAHQTRELELLALALTDEIERSLRGTEAGLYALRTELHDGRLPIESPNAVQALRMRADLMPLVRTLWLVDGGGEVLAASSTAAAPELAAFAPAGAQLAEDAATLSRPFADGSAHEMQVALGIRFHSAQGTSSGWILAALPASALLGAFSAAQPGPETRMAVFRNDGVRLASANAAPSSVSESLMAQRLAQRPNQEIRSFRDGSENLVSLHHVPRYNVKILVSLDLQAALRPWRGAADMAAAVLALLLPTTLAALLFVRRAERRRLQAQRALQRQLVRASRLESLGTLASGVAHDFNNLLAGIVGFGEMARDAAPNGSDQARHLDKVLQASLRGKALVERILAFSRGGARVSTVFEFEPVVEEVLTLLSVNLRPGLVLERGFDATGARLRGDPTQAFEAVMNLCTNALQAMPGNGLLSVHLERAHVAAPRVLSHSALPAGDYVALSVSDQGVGITPQVMEHLFEPFFTTRGAQSGTGLGLAVVHGVVAEFGGAIDVRSTPGQGACFTLYFPECTEAGGAGAPARRTFPEGTALELMVVDDDPSLMALVGELLRDMGYASAGFTDPRAALQALQAQPQRFAAVLTNEAMPGLTGTELAAALRAHAPGLPVLLLSGYGGASLARRATAAGVARVLAKPLQRADLARALVDLLG